MKKWGKRIRWTGEIGRRGGRDKEEELEIAYQKEKEEETEVQVEEEMVNEGYQVETDD